PHAATPFPYTTLFRSRGFEEGRLVGDEADLRQQPDREGADHGEIARRAEQGASAHRFAGKLGLGHILIARVVLAGAARAESKDRDRKSTRLNSSHVAI